jgi:hypothetical protein
MTLHEIWLTLTGRPDEAAGVTASKNGVPTKMFDAGEERVEMLDWSATDSPTTLRERAEAARKDESTVG